MDRTGVVYGMPEVEYHAPKDELSSTGAKLLLESPAKFKYQVLDGHRVHRAGFDLGTAVHTKVLGVGGRFITYPEEHLTKSGNVSTKAETVAWETDLRAAGKIILTPNEGRMVASMAESVLAHPLARMLFERPGKPEVSVFGEYLGVKRRGRFDYLPDDGGVAVDLKSAVDASPAGFARAAARYGYHVQRGHYLDIYERITGERREMLFVVVEKEPPYLVAVHRLNEQFADMGVTEALEAVDVYGRCMASGEWPGYPATINELQPPMFAVYDFQDKYDSEEMQV